MKICWDKLEGVSLNRMGNFKKEHIVYIWVPSCKKCGEPYLTERHRQSEFCGQSCAISGKTHSIETIEKMSKNNSGALNPMYEGKIVRGGLASYDGYKDTLGLYEDIRKQDGTEILEAKCAYCGKWYTPTYVSVSHRLVAVNNLNMGEQRLYCSDKCKQSCPTYNQKSIQKDLNPIKQINQLGTLIMN